MPRPSVSENLRDLARGFGEEVATLLDAVLPEAPPVDVVRHEDRYVIRPGNEPGDGRALVPLFIDGDRVASLEISMFLRWDATGHYLAVETSSFGLSADVDRTPVLRFEYEHDMHTAPHAHIHVHAQRGALSHLLSRTQHRAPHDMSSLHIPVGGSRFRPCLEDLLQFLIVECGFDALDGWRDHVEAGRERWRRRQVAAVVRAVPSEATRVLEELGYVVTAPATPPEDEEKALKSW